MALYVSYLEEDRLDLSFDGNLDISVSQAVCDLCHSVTPDVKSCVVDLSGVERVFDSGLALLHLLARRLHDLGATMVVLGDRPEIRNRMPTGTRESWRIPSPARWC